MRDEGKPGKRYNLSKRDYAYNKYNSLRARSSNDSDNYLWVMYFEVMKELENAETDTEAYTVLDRRIRDIRYAIAALDFLEEVASMYYHENLSQRNHKGTRSSLAEIRWNMVYAKKGGRFRKGSKTPPTFYRDL